MGERHETPDSESAIREKHYVPLTWPHESLKKAGLWTPGRTRVLREMERLVKQRGPIPAALWGADPRRWRAAQKISAILKEAKGWTNTNFVPADPVDILLWRGLYDLSEVEAIMRIKSQFFVDIPEDVGEALFRGDFTLARFVDYLLEHGSLIEPWPRHGEDSLESQACPKMAAFLALRDFIGRHCQAGNTRLRPSTNLRDVLPDSDWNTLDRFLQARFGIGRLIRNRFLGVASPGWAWLALSVAGSVAIGKWLDWQFLGTLLGVLACLIVFGIVVTRLSRPTWRRGLKTTREVVEWILRRRARFRMTAA